MRTAFLAVLVALAGACGDDGDEVDAPLPRFDAPAGADAPAPADAGVDAAAADAAGADAAPRTMMVSVVDNRFVPAALTLRVGDTVIWTHDGLMLHTVTSGLGSAPAQSPGQVFDRVLAPGQTFQLTFTTAGVVPYFCRFHELLDMKGTVTVVQ